LSVSLCVFRAASPLSLMIVIKSANCPSSRIKVLKKVAASG
jgi:hypothetical protein